MNSLEVAKASGQAVAHSSLGADMPIIAALLILLGAYAFVIAVLVFTARSRTAPSPQRARSEVREVRPTSPLVPVVSAPLRS